MNALITNLDYPDPDVIRVGDTYYLASTTMHFFPGAEILRSFDLVTWEHHSFVYETLDDDPAHRLEDGASLYGQGMWAPSFRHHQGEFYLCFSCNDSRKTYLFRTKDLAGPWTRSQIAGFYHDPSLLFDGGRVFLAWGNTEIRITELEPDLSGPKAGGLDRLAVRETGNRFLGYEGSHLYRIQGRYYLFLIHSLPFRWHRVQACFWADDLDGEFRGGDVFDDDLGYGNNGIAQGGLVDTPDGRWFAVLFQDRGAVGRIPVVVEVTWEGPLPVFGSGGRAEAVTRPPETRPGHPYRPLVGGGAFRGPLGPQWQWNHHPDPGNWRLDPAGQLRLRSARTAPTPLGARNTLTQRMCFPRCAAEVTVDGRDLAPGDTAGLMALQGAWAAAALQRTAAGIDLVMVHRPLGESSPQGVERVRRPVETPQVRFRLEASFSAEQDFVRFWFLDRGRWQPLGPAHRVAFQLDHFVGCRFALFLWSAETVGGEAGFSDFRYEHPGNGPA